MIREAMSAISGFYVKFYAESQGQWWILIESHSFNDRLNNSISSVDAMLFPSALQQVPISHQEVWKPL